ncbi:TetR family transcriptional regulator [Streptomyces sp. NPDC005481]|uniref:TetR/AcrR family transcriptional regulator n=1 Tax=Streptomyces sp. NPDC005481 TaxID=3154881 RepID=UPI0033ACA733
MAATAHSSTTAEPRPGLRERKKTKTRLAIREAAYRLIQEQGYEAASVERIAAAAEVSPSTVLRYFPAKEDIVLPDGGDRETEERLRSRPAGEPWPESLRHVLGHILAGRPEVLRLRTRLMAEVPAVRSRTRERLTGTGRMLCRVIGERTGRDPDALDVRVYAAALTGALLETAVYWAEGGHREDLAALLDRTLDLLEHGPAR